MASVNRVTLIGHLGRDPEVRYMPDGAALATISLATTDAWKDKAGERQEKTEWHRIVMFGKVAEIAGEYLKKGALAYFEGRLQTRKWADKDGTERYTTEVVCDRMQMLGGKSAAGEKEERAPSAAPPKEGAKPSAAPKAKGSGFDDLEDDIPF